MSVLWFQTTDLPLTLYGMDDNLSWLGLHHRPIRLDEAFRGRGYVESSSEASPMTAPQRKTVEDLRREAHKAVRPARRGKIECGWPQDILPEGCFGCSLHSAIDALADAALEAQQYHDTTQHPDELIRTLRTNLDSLVVDYQAESAGRKKAERERDEARKLYEQIVAALEPPSRRGEWKAPWRIKK